MLVNKHFIISTTHIFGAYSQTIPTKSSTCFSRENGVSFQHAVLSCDMPKSQVFKTDKIRFPSLYKNIKHHHVLGYR